MDMTSVYLDEKQRFQEEAAGCNWDDTGAHDGADDALLATLLKNINASVTRFRPSPSLADMKRIRSTSSDIGSASGLVLNPDSQSTESPAGQPLRNPTEIDLVCSGGGLKGYFVTGAAYVLRRQLKSRNIRIARYAGASCGAWATMFMATGISTRDWMHTYRLSQRYCENETTESHIHSAYRDMWPWIKERLPEDAYKRVRGKLFLSVTIFDKWGRPRNKLVTDFRSNEDLFATCLASSSIPYITETDFGKRFRGMRVVDGGFTDNCPVFNDGVRRQLVIQLSQVQYPFRLLVNPVDRCIEGLVIRGATQMARFLQGRSCGRSIMWMERKNKKDEIRAPGHGRRVFAAIVAIASIVASRLTGLSRLIRYLASVGAMPVNAIAASFAALREHLRSAGGTWGYAFGVAFVYIVSLLRRGGLLL